MEYKEFVKARKSYLGASDAPIVMGASPWRSQYQLWEDKLGLAPEQKDNYAMRRGRELEPVARAAYTDYTGNVVEPKQVFHPKISYMMANMDGITDDHSMAVEIKCPGEKDHSLAKEGIVPGKYVAQLQHQLAVIGISGLHFFSYRDGDVALVEVGRDESYIKSLYAEERKFWSCVQNLTPPPLTDKDYVRRSDIEWVRAAAEWVRTAAELEATKEKEKIYREMLLELSQKKSSFGHGVKLQKIVRRGTVDYKSIPELEGVDLEKYRGLPIEQWRLTSS